MTSQLDIENGILEKQQTFFDSVMKVDFDHTEHIDMLERQTNIRKHIEAEKQQKYEEVITAPPMDQKQIDEENYDRSLLQQAGDLASWVLAPLNALSAFAIAPMAYDKYKYEWYDPRNWGEQIAVGAKAAAEELFPTYGAEHRTYGKDVMDRYMPNAPEVVRSSAGLMLEVFSDPITAIGVTAPMKFMQQGLKAGKMMESAEIGGAVIKDKNIFKAGLDWMADMRILDPALQPEKTLKGLYDLSELAHRGDRKAAQQLQKELNTPELNEATQKVIDQEMKQVRTNVEKAITLDEAELLKAYFKRDPGTKEQDILMNFQNSNIMRELARKNPKMLERPRDVSNVEMSLAGQSSSLKNLFGKEVLDDVEFAQLDDIIRYTNNRIGSIVRKIDMNIANEGDRAALDMYQEFMVEAMRPYIRTASSYGRGLQMRQKSRWFTPADEDFLSKRVDEAIRIMSDPQEIARQDAFADGYARVRDVGGDTVKFNVDQVHLANIGNCK